MLQIKRKAKLFYADDTTVVVELHPYELNLLGAMRNQFRFGAVQITMRDGLPVRIERAVEGIDLTKGLDNTSQ